MEEKIIYSDSDCFYEQSPFSKIYYHLIFKVESKFWKEIFLKNAHVFKVENLKKFKKWSVCFWTQKPIFWAFFDILRKKIFFEIFRFFDFFSIFFSCFFRKFWSFFWKSFLLLRRVRFFQISRKPSKSSRNRLQTFSCISVKESSKNI